MESKAINIFACRLLLKNAQPENLIDALLQVQYFLFLPGHMSKIHSMLTIKPYIELREVSDWLRLEKKLIRETARSDLCIASNELHS